MNIETKAYERLFEVVNAGSGAKDVDQAILIFSSFYLGKGKEIPKELYLGIKQLSWQEKCERLLRILEIGIGVKGIENITERLREFYKAKGVVFPEDQSAHRAFMIKKEKEKQVVLAEKERQKQEKLTVIKAKIVKDETWLSIVNLVVVFLVAVLIFSSSWMAENWFAYEQAAQKTVKEPYEYVVDRLETYICYITRTGECYHAGDCGYLKSKIETTVYEAKQKGYRACSRCDVTERTTLEITETRQKTVTKMVTKTVEPKCPVFLGGCGILAAVYYTITVSVKKRVEIAQKEMEVLRNS